MTLSGTSKHLLRGMLNGWTEVLWGSMGGQKSCGAQWVDISPVTYIDKCLRALLLQARSVGPKLYLCSGHSDPKYHENAGFDECIVLLRMNYE